MMNETSPKTLSEKLTEQWTQQDKETKKKFEETTRDYAEATREFLVSALHPAKFFASDKVVVARSEKVRAARKAWKLARKERLAFLTELDRGSEIDE